MKSQNGEMQRLSLRLLAGMFLGLTLLFLAENAWELHRQGMTFEQLQMSSGAGKVLASTVSRAINNLLAMVLSFVAIAIPITANMYTPKLVEIFFTDRINIASLVYFAAMGAHAIFAQWAMFDQWAPQTHVAVLWISGVVGFAVVIPYYLYVLEFLNPETIIRRVEERVGQAFPGRYQGAAARRLLHERILQLGNVILRAVDRADRDVAISAITSLERVVAAYEAPKRTARTEWFEADKDLFPGLSTEAIALLRHEMNWVEHACLKQLHLTYIASLTRMPDAVSSISQANRRIAMQALIAGDDATLGLAIRFFNTFIRAAVQKRDAHAVFDVFRQYRGLAVEMLAVHPERSLQIAKHLRYYGEVARQPGISFVYELAAADVAAIVEAAFAVGSPAAADLLLVLRAFRDAEASPRLAKCEAALAAALRATGHEDEAKQLHSDLRSARRSDLEAARKDFASTEDSVFWEVTDRQSNLDYLAPERRAAVVLLLDELLEEMHEDRA
ncbi:MAG: DUF2254 domain-containing protein [Planctomycetes bacterium]|nr:DUF2254 domain-containing protein [Planctomycetota bacterium]